MNWLRHTVGLCVHEWVVYREYEIRSFYDAVIGHQYILRCSKCGAIKRELLP